MEMSKNIAERINKANTGSIVLNPLEEKLVAALRALLPHCEYKRTHTQTDKARNMVSADMRYARAVLNECEE